ncbi:MAG: hypothetical protein PHI72_00205 [Atribacterota bacterium]|nr:hypothetical protein [Atribacterota bacterium]MDD4896798.1 hypothetical protein [Atribacterota bacterium]MDD5636356.1 hypothetical protein [Atribacterota bacterium]
MGYIKSAREIALEKTAGEKLSAQEIAEIKQQEKIDSILAKYYKDQIEPDQLWYQLKELHVKYLKQVQNSFLKSLTYQSNAYDFEKRKKGILAIENLKKTNQSSDIEHYFNQLTKLQEEFQKEKDQLIQYVRQDLEKNPQKRLQTFQQGNQIVIKELSVEEVLEQDKGLKQRLNQIEKKYKEYFNLFKGKMADLFQEINDN